MHCPKCDADVSESYQEYDPDVGIMSGGYYCDACDLPIDEEYEFHDDDVPLFGTNNVKDGLVLNNGCCPHCSTPLESGYGLAGGGGIGPYMYCPAEHCGKTLIKSKDNS